MKWRLNDLPLLASLPSLVTINMCWNYSARSLKEEGCVPCVEIIPSSSVYVVIIEIFLSTQDVTGYDNLSEAVWDHEDTKALAWVLSLEMLQFYG